MRKKYSVLAIVCIVILALGLTFKEIQNDTFYIIKLGDYIVHHGIDFMDHYSIHEGLSYFYPHWLFDCLVYFVYDNFSFKGVYFLVMVCFIVLATLIYFINVKINKNSFIAFWFILCLMPFINVFMVARAQIISYILFLLEIYFLEMIMKTGKNKYMVFLGIVCVLIANIHATVWVFYFILFLPYLFEYFCLFCRDKFKNKKRFKFAIAKGRKFLKLDDNRYYKKILLIFVISLFLGVFSFSKDIPYTYVFKTMLGNSQSYITEHAPMVVWETPQFVVFMGIFLFVLMFTNCRIKLRDFCMIMGLSVMALASVRHTSFLLIIGNVYLLRFMMPFFEGESYTIGVLGKFFLSKVGIVVVIGFVCLNSYSKYLQRMDLKDTYINEKEYPVEAVSYILDNVDVKEMRLFNEYNYGSYLLFYDIPVFIDPRCDLYTKAFNGLDYDIFDDYDTIMSDLNYKKKFDFYGITHVLLSKDSSLTKVLNLDSDYKKIYKDKYFVLFEKVE